MSTTTFHQHIQIRLKQPNDDVFNFILKTNFHRTTYLAKLEAQDLTEQINKCRQTKIAFTLISQIFACLVFFSNFWP